MKSGLKSNTTTAPVIRIEAEMMSDISTANKSSRSFVEEISKQTKNYDRASKSNTIQQKQKQQQLSDYTNKDSGIDSHRDGVLDEISKPKKINQSDLDYPLKQNKKGLKRLNNTKPKFDTLSVTSSTATSFTDSLAEVPVVDPKKLKKKLQQSRELNDRIRKALIDLLALDKLEKQKKLNILKQQRIIEIQKMKINDAMMIKKSMTNFEDPILSREKKLKELLGDNLDSISLEKVIFPTIVKKYDPYGRFVEPIALNNRPYSQQLTSSMIANEFDQFYLSPTHQTSPTAEAAVTQEGDVTYEDLLNIIDDLETEDKMSGKPDGSSYYVNGQLLKGPGDASVYNRHSSYYPETVYAHGLPEPKRYSVLDELNYINHENKYQTWLDDDNRGLDILKSFSETSISSLDLDLVKVNRKITKVTRRRPDSVDNRKLRTRSGSRAPAVAAAAAHRPEHNPKQQPHLVKWDREGIFKDEKLKPRVQIKQLSEFYTTSENDSRKSFRDIVNGMMKKKQQAPVAPTKTPASTTTEVTPKVETPPKIVIQKSKSNESIASRTSTISNISKMFRDIVETDEKKKQPVKALDSQAKKPTTPAAPTRPKRFFLKNLISKNKKQSKKKTTSSLTSKKKSTIERKKENKKRYNESKKVMKQVAKRTKEEEAKKKAQKKKEEQLRKKQEAKIKKSKKKLKKGDKKGDKEKKQKKKKNKKSDDAAKKKDGEAAPAGFLAKLKLKLPCFKKKELEKKKTDPKEEDTVKEIYARRRVLDNDLPGSANNLRISSNKNNNDNKRASPTPALNELVKKNPIVSTSRNNSISELPKQNPIVKRDYNESGSRRDNIVNGLSDNDSVKLYRYEPQQPRPDPFSASNLLLPRRPMSPMKPGGIDAIAKQNPILNDNRNSNSVVDELAKQNPLLESTTKRPELAQSDNTNNRRSSVIADTLIGSATNNRNSRISNEAGNTISKILDSKEQDTEAASNRLIY